MPTRKLDKITITWSELEEILTKAGVLPNIAGIKELTLVHPRELLIHTYQRKNGDPYARLN